MRDVTTVAPSFHMTCFSTQSLFCEARQALL